MDYIRLGGTGLKVSRICLGCMTYGKTATGALKPGSHAWTLNEEESQPFLREALDFGINFFDTANVYSSGASEEVVGKFLKANTRREAVVIATKLRGMMPGGFAAGYGAGPVARRFLVEVADSDNLDALVGEKILHVAGTLVTGTDNAHGDAVGSGGAVLSACGGGGRG